MLCCQREKEKMKKKKKVDGSDFGAVSHKNTLYTQERLRRYVLPLPVLSVSRPSFDSPYTHLSFFFFFFHFCPFLFFYNFLVIFFLPYPHSLIIYFKQILWKIKEFFLKKIHHFFIFPYKIKKKKNLFTKTIFIRAEAFFVIWQWGIAVLNSRPYYNV